MSTPEKERLLDSHYQQKYAQLASETCYAEREKLKAQCTTVDRDLRQEFQIVQEGTLNHCAAERQNAVDSVIEQGHQAIGVVKQQAEAEICAVKQQAQQYVEKEIGAVRQQAEEIFHAEVGKVRQAVEVEAEAKVEQVKNQAE